MTTRLMNRSRLSRLGTFVPLGALLLLLAVGFGTAAFADCTDDDGDGYGNPASGALCRSGVASEGETAAPRLRAMPVTPAAADRSSGSTTAIV